MKPSGATSARPGTRRRPPQLAAPLLFETAMPTSPRLLWSLPWLIAAACATSPDQPPQATELARAISPPERSSPPDPLPSEARRLLRPRMAEHARDMGELVSAIMVLRYPDIAERAHAIATGAHFAQPLTADATQINTTVPDAFFAHERDLRVWAGQLESSAEKFDAFAVAKAYGRLSETCVSCHASYRASANASARSQEN